MFEDMYKFKGELAADAKLTHLDDGGTVCKLVINMPVSTKEAAQEYHLPYKLQVSVFGALAKQCAALKKGVGIQGEGHWRASKYTGTQGDLRTSIGVKADRIGHFVEITDPVVWLEGESRDEAPVRRGKGKEKPGPDSGVEAFLNGKGPGPGPVESAQALVGGPT